ncbi:hypothetical protein BGZ61DRAFT_470275 [Ilyonectria robusta]|uniref:uncharacterized protein n=1 Tax=Ilyonectria robusta TaxID=1079257 RepID=UPI001E8D5A18|nr:uncharacterized protein BGZ61DRAFT_470275 [Ilyonectria robusta]KAH8736749.1 hypothetical protein BGZ61DRAFT_470275 [Ilyonectria robusta]
MASCLLACLLACLACVSPMPVPAPRGPVPHLPRGPYWPEVRSVSRASLAGAPRLDRSDRFASLITCWTALLHIVCPTHLTRRLSFPWRAKPYLTHSLASTHDKDDSGSDSDSDSDTPHKHTHHFLLRQPPLAMPPLFNQPPDEPVSQQPTANSQPTNLRW